MVVAFNDHHSITAAMLAAVPSSMQTPVMFAIGKLGSCTAKIAVPIHVSVSADANAELFCTCSGGRRDGDRRKCRKNVSKFLHVFLH